MLSYFYVRRFDTPVHAKLDLLLLKRCIMLPNGFTDAERAQCVIWMTEGYRVTAVQRLFWSEHSRMPPARSVIRLWRADYQQQGTHTHRLGNGRPKINAKTKNGIRQLFEDNARMSLPAAAAETSAAHARIWNFYEKN